MRSMPTNNQHEGYGTSNKPINRGQKFGDNGGCNGENTKIHPGQFKGYKDQSPCISSSTSTAHHQNHPIHPKNYFTEFTARKALLYGFATLYVISCGLISVAEMFLTLPCPSNDEPIDFPNPAYDGTKCHDIRRGILLGLTQTECSFGRRLVMSILFGGLIGWERRQADRPAGIRTMSLVSLGSCLFTINSAFAFVGGPMAWDASRISAAIPSGVGFLGAGLIFKKTNSDDDNMVVHGLTTAASVWLSAAVGIACGGELYFAASFGTCLMMLLLRFGPRGSEHEDDDDDEEEEIEGDVDRHETDEDLSVSRIEIPEGAEVQPGEEGGAVTMTFRSTEGGQNLPPGLQKSQRSHNSVDGSNYTMTGMSLESSSLVAAETTPMLGSPPQLVTQSLAQSLKQELMLLRSQQQLQQRRKTPTKSARVRKRQSKANLGSIV